MWIRTRDVILVCSGGAAALILRFLYDRRAKRLCDVGGTASEDCAAISSGEAKVIPAEELERFVSEVFEERGVMLEDAREAAKVLVLADLRGIDSHGVARLLAYYTMLAKGMINPTPNIRVVRETASTATVDGDNGLGLVVGIKANAIAMEKAAVAGSGWVSVRNTNHYGIAGAYSLAALERDMIGFSMTNSSCVVAPLWGKDRFLGTNPIAIAFPGHKEKPIVIDMSTSVVTWGKVEEYARMGLPLSEGWTIDSNGQAATSPDAVLASGALRNLGGDRGSSGHKGYCLAAMVDILCAGLSGGNWGPTVDGFCVRTEGRDVSGNSSGGEPAPTGIGHFFGAMRIDGFRDVGAFQRTIDAWIATFRGCAPINPQRPVMIPGDPEWAAMERRQREGIPVKLTVLADFVEVSAASGVRLPFDPQQVNLDAVKRVRVVHA